MDGPSQEQIDMLVADTMVHENLLRLLLRRMSDAEREEVFFQASEIFDANSADPAATMRGHRMFQMARDTLERICHAQSSSRGWPRPD